jgi:hypothetical protein
MNRGKKTCRELIIDGEAEERAISQSNSDPAPV